MNFRTPFRQCHLEIRVSQRLAVLLMLKEAMLLSMMQRVFSLLGRESFECVLNQLRRWKRCTVWLLFPCTLFRTGDFCRTLLPSSPNLHAFNLFADYDTILLLSSHCCLIDVYVAAEITCIVSGATVVFIRIYVLHCYASANKVGVWL